MIKNMLVEVDAIKLKALFPISRVTKGANAIKRADSIKPFFGNCLRDKCPKVSFHLPFPPNVTEKSNRPALYKKLLVDDTAAEITTKLIIELALRIPVAPSV